MRNSVVQGLRVYSQLCNGFDAFGESGVRKKIEGLLPKKPNRTHKNQHSQDRCMDLNLPWALISSIQKRWTTEKMSHGNVWGGEGCLNRE